MKIRLVNNIGKRKTVKLGFSWTFLFFGIFVPLFRLDLKWFLIILIVDLVGFLPTSGLWALVVNVVFSFFYNKLYVKDLLKKGYRGLTTQEDLEARRYAG